MKRFLTLLREALEERKNFFNDFSLATLSWNFLALGMRAKHMAVQIALVVQAPANLTFHSVRKQRPRPGTDEPIVIRMGRENKQISKTVLSKWVVQIP